LKYVENSFTSLFKFEESRTFILETLCEQPRVFKIHHFFSPEEADFLIDFSLKITEEDLRLKRSSTGVNGYTVNSIRTSENAFDSTSHIAISLKKRSWVFPPGSAHLRRGAGRRSAGAEIQPEVHPSSY